MPLPNALNISTTSRRYSPTSWQPTPAHIPKSIYCLTHRYIFILQNAPLTFEHKKRVLYWNHQKTLEVSPMPRPKGSKNKPKTVKATVDFASQIAEKAVRKGSRCRWNRIHHREYRCAESWPESQEGRAEIYRQGNRQNRSQRSRRKPKQRNPQKPKQRMCWKSCWQAAWAQTISSQSWSDLKN